MSPWTQHQRYKGSKGCQAQSLDLSHPELRLEKELIELSVKTT